MQLDPTRPILIVGAPRSGTTWIGKALGLCEGVFYVHEPDNEAWDPRGLKAKRRVGRFPVLAGDDEAPEYLSLWREVFDYLPPGRSHRMRASRKLFRSAKKRGEFEEVFLRAPRDDSIQLRLAGLLAPHGTAPRRELRPVVKSIYASLSAEWIYDRLRPTVLVVLRDLLNVMSSSKTYVSPRSFEAIYPRVLEWIRAGRVPAPGPDLSPLGRVTWSLGVMRQTLQVAAQDHGWLTATHEDLCREGITGFEALAGSLGLTWTDRAAEFIALSDRPGTGYATNRVAAELPEVWRDRLSPGQVSEIRRVLEAFSVSPPSAGTA